MNSESLQRAKVDPVSGLKHRSQFALKLDQ
jgi:hypothetical protein